MTHTFIQKNGYINEKRMSEFLFPDKKSKVDKSVSTPSAQYTKLCNSGNQGETLIKTILHKRNSILKSEPKLWYIIDLLINSGCRITEILSINSTDILPNGTVKIKALKGGQNRIIASSDARDYLINCRTNCVNPFMDYNRFYIYRTFKKIGIKYVHSGNTKDSVTHAFRHANTEIQRKANVESNVIKAQLGHKKKSTQKHYGRG